MNAPFRIPAPPPAAILRTLSRFDRTQLAGFIAVAIDLLDFADGDPEAEEDDHAEDDDEREDDDPAEQDDHGEDDDPAGMMDEDGKNTGGIDLHAGPGCTISDAAEFDCRDLDLVR